MAGKSPGDAIAQVPAPEISSANGPGEDPEYEKAATVWLRRLWCCFLRLGSKTQLTFQLIQHGLQSARVRFCLIQQGLGTGFGHKAQI